MTYASIHTHYHPYIFLPLTTPASPNTHMLIYLSIHHLHNPITISIIITQELHHTNTTIRCPCSVTSLQLACTITTKQQSKITKTPKQCFSQTTNRNQSLTRHHPTHPDHHRRLLAPVYKIHTCSTEHTLQYKQYFKIKNIKRCRDGNVNVCKLKQFLFGLFFTPTLL